jgi:hypothetical protein
MVATAKHRRHLRVGLLRSQEGVEGVAAGRALGVAVAAPVKG